MKKHVSKTEHMAEVVHTLWMNWAKALLEEEPNFSVERKSRWSTYMVPYSLLAEEVKEVDRRIARMLISEIEAYKDKER